MSFFVVDRYAIRPEKQDEFMALIKRITENRIQRPSKSWDHGDSSPTGWTTPVSVWKSLIT
jgi:hypothetical protein